MLLIFTWKDFHNFAQGFFVPLQPTLVLCMFWPVFLWLCRQNLSDVWFSGQIHFNLIRRSSMHRTDIPSATCLHLTKKLERIFNRCLLHMSLFFLFQWHLPSLWQKRNFHGFEASCFQTVTRHQMSGKAICACCDGGLHEFSPISLRQVIHFPKSAPFREWCRLYVRRTIPP